MKRKIPRGYADSLNKLTDRLFEEAAQRDWTWPDFAREAGLSYPTVWALGWRRTRVPEYLTVWKLAKAVGMVVQLESIRKRYKKSA